MLRLESLLDGIAHLNGAFDDPESTAYQLRNPLLIRSFGAPGRHDTDTEGRRRFNSIVAGYRACLFDIEKKAGGKSRAGLASTDPLSSLLKVYGITEAAGQKKVVYFVRRALQDQSIDPSTQLSYFVEDMVK